MTIGPPPEGPEEGMELSFSASFTDPGADTHTIRWDFGDGNIVEGILDPKHTYGDNDEYTVILTVTDDDGGIGTGTLNITVVNVPPTVDTMTVPMDPVNIGDQPISFSATFTDPGTDDTHDALWEWGDDGDPTSQTDVTSPASASHTYSDAGVYTVTLTVTDDDGGSDTKISSQYIVIYDPEGGFVTGGGWIDSPECAYAADPELTGKANFGFVSKYKKGADVPTGETEFNFRVADLNFHSTSYDWLVVASSKAMYKGEGTVNGEGAYGFMLSAIDAELTPVEDDVDKFRIKIWDKDTEVLIYDNQLQADEDADPTTEIGGGNIVIHEGDDNGGSSAAPAFLPSLPKDTCLLAAYPNPNNPDVWIPYQLGSDCQVIIRIYDIAGHLVRKLDLGNKVEGYYITKDKAAYWDGKNEAGESVASGIYFYTMQAGSSTATRKMTILK